MPQTTPVLKRRGRPRRKESFADWMDRLDMQVDREAERLTAERTILRPLSPGQRRIVQMLIEHLRRLPTLGPEENVYDKREYLNLNRILCRLFESKYPNWTQRTKNGLCDIGALPNGDEKLFTFMLRNCAGRAPAELDTAESVEDD